MKDLSNEIKTAKKAALQAGYLLLNSREKFNIRLNKDSKDIKLQADIESEMIIKSIISTDSTFPILAEETGKSKQNLGDTFWVIDPLDGTANYNRGIPFCCVSIGLIRDMDPILGVIYDFNNDHMYVGDKSSMKSTMNDQIIRVSKKNHKNESVLITGLPHKTDYSKETLNNMINDMKEWQKIRMMGSAAMSACYVASGKVEQYEEKGIYLWDVLAGAALVESSGGAAKIFNRRENFQVDVVFSNVKI